MTTPVTGAETGTGTVPSLASLRAAGVLSALDVRFAQAMERLGARLAPVSSGVPLAAALVSHTRRQGHVCLSLARLAREPLLDAEGEPLEVAAWPEAAAWTAAVRESPLAGDGSQPTPLVVNPAGRIYLYRYWRYERRLAAALASRASASAPTLDEGLLRAGLERLFPAPVATKEPTADWQRVAAATAVLRRLAVVSGGPGTGKTSTVVKILALLAEQALAANGSAPRAALLAPTGKAAARLSESVRRAIDRLPVAAAVRAALPTDAATVHRALGTVRAAPTRFRHDAQHPLPADVVVLDEASMVDLALMAKLVDAVPPTARLVLLGDPDQLTSVESGAILGDVCDSGRAHLPSASFGRRLRDLVGGDVPCARTPSPPPLADCLVTLRRSYRFGPHSGVGTLARAVHAGRSDDVRAVLRDNRFPDVTWTALSTAEGPHEALVRAAVAGFRPLLSAADPSEMLSRLTAFRVLCAHRSGSFGVERWNATITSALVRAGLLDGHGAWPRGRPVLVTRNDYGVQLFNGDVGVVAADRSGAPRVWFSAPDGALRDVRPARLPPHETAWAMTVHKSQGSEYDDVLLLLPTRVSRVVSRELFYTAVTRARRRVHVCATRSVLQAAVERGVERASGLRDALWGDDAPSSPVVPPAQLALL